MSLKIEGSNKLHMQVGDKVCMSSMHASKIWLQVLLGLWLLLMVCNECLICQYLHIEMTAISQQLLKLKVTHTL